MDSVLEQIINGLLCTDTEQIRQATTELNKTYEEPETLPALCQMVVSTREPHVRQFAAVLLNKRLQKLRNWQMVPEADKESIKSGMLQALIAEKEKSVKNSIAQLIGTLVRHEKEKKDSWLAELLSFIYGRCSSDDPIESELGSSIFSTLIDTAPEQFVSHTDSICQMFATVLASAEAKGNLATPTVVNLTMGMSCLMPFVTGHTSAEQTVLKTLPLILKTVYAFALKGDEREFAIVFDVMDSIVEYVPKLLNNNVQQIMELCLQIVNNKQIDEAIRVQVITFIGRVVRIKKKMIAKQKLLEPILAAIFDMMSCDADDADDYFSGESGNSPVTAATQTLDLLAINMSPEKLIPPLLQILEPALQNPDPLRRRAAFLCIAVIAEGCSEAICSKYLEVMLNIIKGGIADSAPPVRIASFYALGQFSEHLQPAISKFAPQILPVLFEFLHQLVVELKMGQPEPKHTDRMFYALETYCQNLEEDIVPHLPLLMERLFETLDTQYSANLRAMALSTISASAMAAKENIMPYVPQIVSILKHYLVKDCTEEMWELRNEAIDTLAAITRVVGKDNFLPLANDTMTYCLMMLDDGPDDPDFRRAIYNLIGAMSLVVNERMSAVFPKIIDRIIESVISTDDIIPVSTESKVPTVPNVLLDELNGDQDIDLDNTDDEDDDDDCFQVENDFVYEKEEAIQALQEFATNTGSAFAPYLQLCFENVYKVVDHPQDNIRKAAVEAICAFVIALNKMGDCDGVKRACAIIMPKFMKMVRNDEDQTVCIHILEVVADLLNEVKQPAVPSMEIADLIFALIKDVVNNKMACQFNEPNTVNDEEDADESECDEQLIENACNLLPQLGKALTPEIFSMYFGRFYQFYVNRLSKAIKNDLTEQRAFVYGVLADCFQALGLCVVTYFDTLCPMFVNGVNDTDPRARQNCFYGLGELVLWAEEKSYESFHIILQALSGAIAAETNPSALDNICGAVSRLIVTNHNMVPLAQVLPVLFTHLPLREDKEENEMVHRALRLLYTQSRPSIMEYLEQILVITLDALYKNEMPDEDSKNSAVAFVKEIREQYADKFNNVVNSNSDVLQFVQTLI